MTTPDSGRGRTALSTVHAHESLRHGTTDIPRRAYGESGQAHAVTSSPHKLLLPRSLLIGRDHETATIQQLLMNEEAGLLTLTGPGGIGKTRLALQVAYNLLDHFVDGVYFVSLAPLTNPNLVLTSIAETLGMHEAGSSSLHQVQTVLKDRQTLLVLDNFEQILAAAPLAAALLSHCRRLKILITSRAPLHLYGEHEFSVPVLALPDTASPAIDSIDDLAQVAAVALFVQRAKEVKSDFALTAANAADVAAICIGLDGLPLAVELAAARIKMFSPPEILALLRQRLMLLTGGARDLPERQRTLRDEIAWSYDLLSADEQMLFRRLAVFVGGFTLEAAQAVGDATGASPLNSAPPFAADILEQVTSLVDKNLVRREEAPDYAPRFGMLETIREFGLEQLAAGGESEAICRRHADYFTMLAEEADPKLRGPDQAIWLQRLETDYPNLRAALAWSLREGSADHADRTRGLRLTGALSWFWHLRTRFDEARNWCDRALALNDASDRSAVRARALQAAGLAAQM